ncbi:MAG: hypothetical protein BWY68_00775 [bacterium ADurb.Bin400]|nr:MAG: hypothetical protein BWY68_00775 [bacterium ADurb.Bin400]
MSSEQKERFKKEFIARLIGLSVKTIKFADELNKTPSLRSVADQLIRSTTSIGANVTEAKGASSKKDYIKFFEIALKSAYETQYWIMVVENYNVNYAGLIKGIKSEVIEVSKMLNSSVQTLKGKKDYKI